ncbi:MAG: rhodanese-like domain-containing protein [Opitutales bacterium]|nr:rhodanese-like domain-containing protein [Opitutales bacterium]
MKNILKLVLLALSTLLCACATKIPDEAIMQRYGREVLIDVRTPQEYDEAHVRGAILIPVDELEAEIDEYGIEKDAKIGVYCRRGVRAERAREILLKKGYTNVRNLGGIKKLQRIAQGEDAEDLAPKHRSRESIF